MRSLFFSSLIALFGVWTARAASAPCPNPLVERWPADVLFYQSFDTGTMTPDIGYASFNEKAKGVRFEEGGVRGACFAGEGRFNYNRKDPAIPLIDTTKPGTVVVWVKYLEERQPIVRQSGEWEEGFPILQATGTDGNTLYLMKSADSRWKGGTIKLHLQATKPDGKTYCAGACGAHSSFVDWKVGEWRMVAAGWTAGKLRVSINGEPFRESPIKVPVGNLSGHLFVQGSPRTRLDELVILSRALTDAEVKFLFEQERKGTVL